MYRIGKEHGINNYLIGKNSMSQKSVKFHVKSDDYFGTVATILKLTQYNLREAIKEAPQEERVLIKKTFKNLENDLMFLQRDYKIVKK